MVVHRTDIRGPSGRGVDDGCPSGCIDDRNSLTIWVFPREFDVMKEDRESLTIGSLRRGFDDGLL